MPERVYITRKQMATFTCPQCKRARTTDVSKYARSSKTIKVKVRCPCGHSYTAILEKRRRYRKDTSLPGTYQHYVDGRPRGKGLMTVRDLSVTGMKLRVNPGESFAVGDLLKVEFHLDDAQRTLIRKKVVIRNVNMPYLGTELAPTETVDKALGFYLFT
jgi:hypothetical protein